MGDSGVTDSMNYDRISTEQLRLWRHAACPHHYCSV